MISRRALLHCTLSLGLLACAGPRAAGAPEGTDAKLRVIHVVVALCDNIHQGIVPVPAALGNGDDPARNLYWGAAYGVKTFFNRAKDWQSIAVLANPAPAILERAVFRKQGSNVWLVADAYRGAEIRKATEDFFSFAAGREGGRQIVDPNGTRIVLPFGGGADMVAYVGHDGLMDFSLGIYPARSDGKSRDIAVLACASKQYFATPLRATGATPLVLTTGLMAPEAYVMKAIADGWAAGESGAAIRERAAQAYAKYQKISPASARRLFSN